MSTAPSPESPLRFKFHFVNKNGQQTGFLRKKGFFDGTTIHLATATLPIHAVAKAIIRKNRLAFIFVTQSGQFDAITIQLGGPMLRTLHSAVNVVASAAQAETHRKSLEAKGRGGEYRIELCPYCHCVIDRSGLPDSPQTYCAFCDTVGTLVPHAHTPTDEKTFHHCAMCELYSQPTMFTTLYVYFLLVIYGYQYQTRYMCHSCMRSEAWKMVGVNLFFVIGFPFAVYQLVRAYAGGSALSKTFAGLDNANTALKARQFERAAAQYQKILARVEGLPQPVSLAGVKYNLALAFHRHGQFDAAAALYENVLADCANYVNAAQGLLDCYTRLNRTEDKAKLLKQWSDEHAA